MPISDCWAQTPHVFFATHASFSSVRFVFGAGFTVSFLYVYSPQLSHGCARAIRSARSRVILSIGYFSWPDGPTPGIEGGLVSTCLPRSSSRIEPIAPITPAASARREKGG